MDRFCRACGAAIRPGDRFCGSCGAAVATEPVGVDEPAPSRFQETFAPVDRGAGGGMPAVPTHARPHETDDPARRRFRETFAGATEAPRADAPTAQSGGAVSVAIAVLALIAAIVLAPIGLGVLILGGILAAVVGLSFTGSGSSPRTGDQSMAVAGAVIGTGEAVIGLLAALA